MDEECPLFPPQHQIGPHASRPALPGSGDTLFHDSAAEVGVDQPLPDAFHRVAWHSVFDTLAMGETRKGFGLERAQLEPLLCPLPFADV